MYLSHWGLKEPPYRDGLDVRCFYKSPVHNEALARLHYLVDQNRRVGLLLGGAGTGKSMLLEVFARDLRRAGKAVVRVDLLGIGGREFFWQVAAGWGLRMTDDNDTFALWRSLSDRLAESRLARQDCVLLLDNADEASDEVLRDVLRLVQCDPSSENRLTVVVAASQHRVARLSPRLLDLAMLRIDLTPWDEQDTQSYIQQSLARAGRQTPAFAASALGRLHELSGGVPRRVSQLADLALLAGAGQRLPEIDPATIESVYQELGVV
jgi:general secretion pathway protein A